MIKSSRQQVFALVARSSLPGKLGQRSGHTQLTRTLAAAHRFDSSANFEDCELRASSRNFLKYNASRNFSFYTGTKMIVYSRVASSDAPAITKHLIKYFFRHEPFGLALGLTIDQVESWYPSFVGELLSYYEPVSFMAKDSETNEIIGVAINIIMDLENRSPPPSMKKYISKEKQPVKWQIATFLEDLEEGVDPVTALSMDTTKTNLVFACLFLSVAPEYGGQGIGKTLVRESENEAKLLDGVTIAMTDVTSQFSYLVMKRLGYDCIKEVQYLSYHDPDRVPIFEGRDKALGVHTHARVMAKKL